MKLKIVALRDQKAGLYQSIHCQRTAADAVRELSYVVNEKKSNIATYPGDFDLYQLGEIDDETGEVTSMKALFIVGALSLRKPEEVSNVNHE